MKSVFCKLLLGMALAVASTADLAGEAITVPTIASGFDYYQGSYSLGFSFTANANVQVTGLGFYDDLKNGLTQSHPVGIYDRVTQVLLATATVAPSDPLTGFFHYTPLVPALNLTAGKTYVVMALVRSEKYLAFNALDPTWTVDPAITFTGGAVNYANPSATTLLYPDTFVPVGSGADFGPNMILGPAAPVGPSASLSPASLTFATQTVGTTSAPQVVTYSSVGTSPVTISSITSNGDFTETSNCPLAGIGLAPGASCQITVTFLPNLAGTRTGNITLFDDAPGGSPRTIVLSGIGSVSTTPTITVSPALSFPPTQAGSASAPLSLAIANTGAGPLAISLLQVVGGEFTIARDACTGVPVMPLPALPCLVDIVFAPATQGARAATLRIISNAPASPTLVSLLGTGTAAPAGTLLSEPAIAFTDQVVGTSSGTQRVVITNVGVVPVSVSSVNLSGAFAQTNDCTVIAPGATCVVNVTFTPTTVGAIVGTLTVLSDATNAVLAVGLAGNGVRDPAAVVELSVTSLSYGDRVMGVSSTRQDVTLRNAGGSDLLISRIYTTGDFTLANRCPGVVAPGATCLIEVTFAPSVPGARTGALVVESNAPAGPKSVPLGGTGCRFFTIRGIRTGTLLCR